MDPSTVTRHARHLGYPDITPKPSATDWKAVQAYYDEGHSIAECRDRFARAAKKGPEGTAAKCLLSRLIALLVSAHS